MTSTRRAGGLTAPSGESPEYITLNQWAVISGDGYRLLAIPALAAGIRPANSFRLTQRNSGEYCLTQRGLPTIILGDGFGSAEYASLQSGNPTLTAVQEFTSELACGDPSHGTISELTVD